MADTDRLICPRCGGDKFRIKYQVSYEYTYIIDADAPGLKNNKRFFPFLYDDRQQIDGQQFLECITCGAQFPYYCTEWDEGVSKESLQRAVQSSQLHMEHGKNKT